MANGDYQLTAEENLKCSVNLLGSEVARGQISLGDAVLMLKGYLDEGKAQTERFMEEIAQKEKLKQSAITKLSEPERQALGLD